jgi:hypothetical protein
LYQSLLRTFGLLFPMEAKMRVCGAALKASLLAATMLATPTSAETFIPFHSGVNLSVAPGGANSSSEPLDEQQVANGQRLDEVADIGFDFVRLRVALAPWTDTGSALDQQKALTLANGIVQRALGYGLRVDVVMFAPDHDGYRFGLHRRSHRGGRMDCGMASGPLSPS